MKGIMRMTVALITALCTVLGGLSIKSADISQFEDTKTHWAREYIDLLCECGAIKGMEDGLFHPNETVTNAQLVTMLIKSQYGEIDPVDDNWYSGYMDYALKKGIITDLETEFPNSEITRQSTARIVHELIVRAYNEQDEENWQDAESLSDLYSCHTCVMHIAQVYVKGIMMGRDDGAFHLTDTLTRAEAATIVMRIIEPSFRRVPLLKTEKDSSLITAEKAIEMIENGAVIIDVRSTEDYALGHIKGSISVPITDIEYNIDTAMEGIDTDRTIIVYCRRGTNSRKAATILGEAGYTNVYDLGGVENGEYELVTK